MFAYFCVAVGGAMGSLCRFWLASLVAARYGNTFPWGTLVINVTGSFIIGVFAALNEPEGHMRGSPAFRQFFMIGICGGYTTFSSFSLETLRAMQNGQWLYAGGNVVLSVVLCLVAVWLGYALGTLLNSVKGH
jgi:fluoride exporter